MSNITYTSKDFIQKILIEQTESLLKNFDYYSFSIISQGIETLGAFLDTYDFHKGSESKKRFKKALKILFPPTYSNPIATVDILYKYLRCGLAHVSKPQNGVILTSYKSGATDLNHLTIVNSNLLLVADTFFKHFKTACERIIAGIENQTTGLTIDNGKKNCNLITINQVVSSNGNFTTTGSTIN